MTEIKKDPIVFEDLLGREFTVFDQEHTHSDILRYVVDDTGYRDVRMILDVMEEEDANEVYLREGADEANAGGGEEFTDVAPCSCGTN